MEPLHEHNQKTYENICCMYDEGIQRVAVVQPTGSGKSLLMAKLIEDNPNSRFFVLSTSHKINDQFKSKLDDGILERMNFNIYCNMPNMKQEVMETLQPDYILLDEMHRALAKEWSKGIMRLLEMYPDAKVLGLSATPIRYLNRCRNVAEELFGGNLACDMSLSQAILDGILPMARYVCGVYSFQKDAESLNKKIAKSCNSEEEKQELLRELKVLKENLNKGHGVSDIFRKYIASGNEKFVVFLKNTKHVGIMKPVIEKWFTDAGFSVRLYEVHSKNVDRDKEFLAFREDKEDGIVKLCLSVAMLTEGIHGDIDGVIMLRETISPNMYFQMIGRAFACGKKTIPLIFDLVANSQFISDAADNFPNELRGEIEKRKEECEKEGKDYEVGFDVDEFIVMDEFMDVVSGFKAIEGRIKGGRNYWAKEEIETLKYYFPKIGGMGIVKQGLLSRHGYNDIKRKAYEIGLKYQKNQKYIPNKGDDQILIENYSQYGRKILDLLPHMTENQIKHRAKQLGLKFDNHTWTKEEYRILDEDYGVLPMKELMKKLPNRSKTAILSKVHDLGLTSDRSIDWGKEDDKKLYLLYPELGSKMFEQLPGKTNMQIIRRIKQLGIKKENPFIAKMRLVHNALNEGVVISKQNQYYKDVNLYEWCICNRKNFSEEELEIINQVIPNRKLQIAIKVVDCETKKSNIYPSKMMAARALHENLYILKSKESIKDAIQRRISGQITTPYKGRFMFYYATDEEVKKYLEDNKVS